MRVLTGRVSFGGTYFPKFHQLTFDWRGLMPYILRQLIILYGESHIPSHRSCTILKLHERTNIILFLTWHDQSIHDDKNDDLYTSCQCLVDVTMIIESMKTTSMETVSTGVLDKNKGHYLRSKDKAANHMIYGDIYNCICQNTKMTIDNPLRPARKDRT